MRNLFFGSLSSSGKLTMANHGPAPVDMMVAVQGYLVSPSGTEAGSSYQDVPESRIVDTRAGTGGVPSTPVPADGSITFQVTGTDGIPSTGVTASMESVAALNATTSGWLSVYPAGATDPNNSVLNFNAGDSQDNDMTAADVSAVSPTGQQTITNHSSGTVDVVVSVRGYYLAPEAPAPPGTVSVSVSGTSATVTWTAPGTDGGSAVTGYTVTAWPDSATATVGGAISTTTLSGLASAATDTFTVSAANAVGSGSGATFSPPNVVSGTVKAPSGVPVGSGFTVKVYLNDPPSLSATDWTPTLLGTTTTDASGNWFFIVPPYSSLPADAQTAASTNGGTINVEAAADGEATTGGVTYQENSLGDESAWVGTSGQATPPTGYPFPVAQVMTLQPPGTDLSANDTPTNQDPTFSSQNFSGATDSNGTLITNSASESSNTAAPTDAYGFQELYPDNYNPFIATDGTDLASVPVAPDGFIVCGITHITVQSSWTSRTKFGEEHAGWDSTGSITMGFGAQITVGTLFSSDALDWKLSGGVTTTNGTTTTVKTDPVGPQVAHFAWIVLEYQKQKRHHVCVNVHTSEITSQYDTWWRGQVGIHTYSDPSTQHNFYAGTANYYSTDDGPNGLAAQEQAHRSYVYDSPKGFTWCVSSYTGQDYKLGVSIAGFGVWAQSTRTNNTQQCIVEGSGSAHQHWIWSHYGNPSTYTGALHVLYAY